MSLTHALVVREATSDADLEAWRDVRLAVLPDERAPTVEEMRAWARPETAHLLAEVDGVVAGSGLLDRSSFGYAFLQPRVLPDRRRRGIGSALLAQLAERAVAIGFTEAGSHTEVDGAFAFAERFGFREVYRQIEQVRTIGEESLPTIPAGITVVTAAERPDLWAKAYDPFAIGAIADMATHLPVNVTREQWEGEWLSWPEATFLALDGDEIVGCAGLGYDADRPDRSEQAFTGVVRRWRGRGVASALKRLTLHYAQHHGVREIYTWTQEGNADMRTLNERLGFRYGAESISVRGPLPLQSAQPVS